MFLYECETEITADLMRFFAIDASRIGSAVSLRTAAACAACMPRESMVVARYKPAVSVSYADVMLNAMASAMVGRRIPLPGAEPAPSESALPEFESSTIDEFDRWYNESKFERSEQWQIQ